VVLLIVCGIGQLVRHHGQFWFDEIDDHFDIEICYGKPCRNRFAMLMGCQRHSRRQNVGRRTIFAHDDCRDESQCSLTFFTTPSPSEPPTASCRIRVENAYPKFEVASMPYTAPTTYCAQASQLLGYTRSPLHNMALSDDTHSIETSQPSDDLLSHPARSTPNNATLPRRVH
jgi:hypothetical protein